MKSTLIKSLFPFFLLLFILVGCKKDDDGGNDLTTQLVGEYLGDYSESTDGSTITAEEVTTVVSKVSDSEIRVVIQVLPGLSSVAFNAKMTDETNFTVPKFQLFDSDVQGEGRLDGTTLHVDLVKDGMEADAITYVGTKQ
jgi:hypothetical protein